ncbi:MAG: hypothetical protein M3Z35_07450, partial [Nitrospirota bacterium]|nr:hypothetical protein [Nitrospirota bacterium]
NSTCGIWLLITNIGLTPGTITETLLMPLFVASGASPPNKPPYDERARVQVRDFLHKDDAMRGFRQFPITDELRTAIRTKRHTLYVIGYLDYVDQFSQRHRAGYARRYNPDSGADNPRCCDRAWL